MKTHNLWKMALKNGWADSTYDAVLKLYSNLENYLAVGWIGSISWTIMMSFVTLLNQPWARIFVWIIIITALIYVYIVYRPVNYYRDLSGYNADLFWNVDSSDTMARQRLLKRARKENSEAVLKTPIYQNGWTYLCGSDAVERKGVKYVEVLGEDLAVFRTSNGKVHVVDAYCPHLGANMGVGGMVKDDCLQCPFHGWRFDGETGKCKSIPYSEKVPEIAKIRTWKSCDVNNMIFVWYHADGKEPTYEVEPIDEIMSGRYWYVGKTEHVINATVQDIAEGSSDREHLQAVHIPLWFREKRFSPDKPFNSLPFFSFPTTSDWEADSIVPHKAKWQLNSFVRLFNRTTIVKTEIAITMEGGSRMNFNINMSSFGVKAHALLINVITPIGPMLQRSVSVVYSPPSAMLQGRLFLYGSLPSFENDLMIYQYKKINRTDLLTKEEDSIVRCRRWYSQFFSESSPRLKIQNDTLAW